MNKQELNRRIELFLERKDQEFPSVDIFGRGVDEEIDKAIFNSHKSVSRHA